MDNENEIKRHLKLKIFVLKSHHTYRASKLHSFIWMVSYGKKLLDLCELLYRPTTNVLKGYSNAHVFL